MIVQLQFAKLTENKTRAPSSGPLVSIWLIKNVNVTSNYQIFDVSSPVLRKIMQWLCWHNMKCVSQTYRETNNKNSFLTASSPSQCCTTAMQWVVHVRPPLLHIQTVSKRLLMPWNVPIHSHSWPVSLSTKGLSQQCSNFPLYAGNVATKH